MECPSCHHIQEEAPECAACGVIVAKAESRARLMTEPEGFEDLTHGEAASNENAQSALIGIAVVLIAVALGYALLSGVREGRVREPEPTETAVQEPREQSPIEMARAATVGVESAWAKGAGFFVNDSCQVVTSARIVDSRAQREKIEKKRETAENQRRLYRDQKKKAREKIQHGAPQRPEREEKRVERAYQQSQYAQDKRERLDREARDLWLKGTEIYVTRPGGTRSRVTQFYLSSRRDLALLWLPDKDCPFLELARTEGTSPRTQVYAVGMSGRQTRIFRARTTELSDDRKPYLALDRWMGGGAQGGPLVSPGGRVIGVVTRPVPRMDGHNGYAIPIEEVWTELGHHFEVPLAGN